MGPLHQSTQIEQEQLSSISAKLHIVLPAYNEEAALPILLSRFSSLSGTIHTGMVVWIVDDGSSDDTPLIAERGMRDLDIKLVSHRTNLGLGKALKSGLSAVLELASTDDALVVMDADDTHDVGLIPELLISLQAGAEIAIASRFTPGGNDSTAPLYRRLLSRGASLTLRLAIPGIRTRDLSSGYRAYRVSLLQKAAASWGDSLIEETGFACMVELLLKLRAWNPVIQEVPFFLRYDLKRSPSKLQIGKTALQYFKIVVRGRSWVRQPTAECSKP